MMFLSRKGPEERLPFGSDGSYPKMAAENLNVLCERLGVPANFSEGMAVVDYWKGLGVVIAALGLHLTGDKGTA